MFWVCYTSLRDWLINSRHLLNHSDAIELEINHVFPKFVFPRWASRVFASTSVHWSSVLLIGHYAVKASQLILHSSAIKRVTWKRFTSSTALFIFVAVSRLPLGVSDKRIRDSALSASSFWDRYHAASRGRLHICKSGRFRGAWSARRNVRGQWLQVST